MRCRLYSIQKVLEYFPFNQKHFQKNVHCRIIRYATLLHRIGDNREGSEQSMNVDRKSLEFTICRQSGKQTAIQKVCF